MFLRCLDQKSISDLADMGMHGKKGLLFKKAVEAKMKGDQQGGWRIPNEREVIWHERSGIDLELKPQNSLWTRYERKRKY